MSDQRNKMEKDYVEMEARYENYIANIQRVLCKDHWWFNQ